MCASLVTPHIPTMIHLCQCHVRYCLVNSVGDLQIRTCKSSSLLGIGNITRYSQQIHNVKSRGVNYGYLGDYTIDPLHSNNFPKAGGVRAFEGILNKTNVTASCWKSLSGSMSSSCVIRNFFVVSWY
jgi:hypothetical protein